MSYDNTSYYGDMVVDEYDDKNNFINPQTPFGFLVYHLLGDGFDLMSEHSIDFLNNFALLSANSKSLDNFWGVSYNLPRPSIKIGSDDERKLNDEEYRIYLYLRKCRLMTREDIEINMNKCFQIDDYEIRFSQETLHTSLVDHMNYNSKIDEKSNIGKQDDDDTLVYVTDFENDDDVLSLNSLLSSESDVIEIIEIPSNSWDKDFLNLLEKHISIKGNIKIKEYRL